MKRFVLFMLAGYVILNIVSAQTVLIYEIHALKADMDNPMSYCEYKEPGHSGVNVTWDFSDLEFIRSFTGFLSNSFMTATGANFPGSNTELAEFDSRFYFDVGNNKVEQYGYSSADGRLQTHYDVPFVKMKFPFSYGNHYSGTYSGKTYFSGVLRGTVTGSYVVEADAYGKLILPGGTSHENTLRVRTEKSYSSDALGAGQEVDIVTYRWYSQSHRYPLLVLTEYTTKSGGITYMNHQAAYNNNAIKSISPINVESIKIYPNPASSHLTLEFDVLAACALDFCIYDTKGRMMRKFSQDINDGGLFYFDLSDRIAGLSPATYYLSIYCGNEKIGRKSFTLVK